MKSEEIAKRLTEFRKSQHITVRVLSEQIGMEEGTLGIPLLGKRNIAYSTLEKIIETYPQLSIEWVLFGRGEMLLTEEQVNFAAFKVENDELKMQVKEQQEQIKKLEAQVEVLMRTIHGKMEG